ncbi:MAG: hypothetical protein NC340_03810 [Ruminococcus flavefaciens]|nr:hypothetical protein [Ruminococcus flavefaciens]MCM1229176.1 hypothetical protein [Ruminococcus flavefaciens]
MKNANVRKINTLGKVSRILLIIIRVLCILGIVGCLLVSVAFLAIPKTDVITADGTVSAQIVVDGEQIPSIFSDDILDLEENDIDFDFAGTGIKWLVEKNKVGNDMVYDINGTFDVDKSNAIIFGVAGATGIGAVMCALVLIAVIFGGKFAKALEVCNSPFEADVLTAMKKFAFSLIPIGVFEILVNGNEIVSLTTAFIVIVVIMFAFIFKYGAELQKESDETV